MPMKKFLIQVPMTVTDVTQDDTEHHSPQTRTISFHVHALDINAACQAVNDAVTEAASRQAAILYSKFVHEIKS